MKRTGFHIYFIGLILLNMHFLQVEVNAQETVEVKFIAPISEGGTPGECENGDCEFSPYTFQIDGVMYTEKELVFDWQVGSKHHVKAIWAGHYATYPRTPTLFYLFRGWSDGLEQRERTVIVTPDSSTTYAIVKSDSDYYYLGKQAYNSDYSITYPAELVRFIPEDIPLKPWFEDLYEETFVPPNVDAVYIAVPDENKIFRRWHTEEFPNSPEQGTLFLTRNNPATLNYDGPGTVAWPTFVDKKIYTNDFSAKSNVGLWYLTPSKWQFTEEGGNSKLSLIEPNPNGNEFAILTSYSWEIFTIEFDAQATDPGRPNYFIIFGSSALGDMANNSYYIQFAAYGAVNLFKTVNGQNAIIDSVNIDFSMDLQQHHIRVERLYNKEGGIVIFADDQFLFELEDSQFETGYLALGSWKSTATFDNINIEGMVHQNGTVDLQLPADHDFGFPPIVYDLEANYGETVEIPVTVSTFEDLNHAQLTLNYNSKHLEFKSVEFSENLQTNAQLNYNPEPEFLNSDDPYYDKNVFVEISGDGSPLIVGNDNLILNYQFRVINDDYLSLFLFDRDCDHTWVKTVNDEVFCGEQIDFNVGIIKVTDDGSHFDVDSKIEYFSNNARVPDAEIIATGPIETRAISEIEGQYKVPGLPEGVYNFTVQKNGDVRNAVTGSDLLFVLQNLAYLTDLDDDQHFAADVTEDGRISGSDAVAMLRYLAFFPSSIAQTGAWRFLPGVTSMYVAQDEIQDFKAFLLGDVNGSWGSNQAISGKRNPALVDFFKSEHEGKFAVSIRTAENSGPVHTLQAKIFWQEDNPSEVEFIRTANSLHFAAHQPNDNSLSLALATIDGISGGQEIGHFLFKELDGMQELDAVVTHLVVNDVVLKSSLISENDGLAVLPTKFQLHPNYPNPFNPETTIAYDVPHLRNSIEVNLAIYSVQGQVVRRYERFHNTPGTYEIKWDGRNNWAQYVGTGTYIAHIQAGKFSQSIKMLLVK